MPDFHPVRNTFVQAQGRMPNQRSDVEFQTLANAVIFPKSAGEVLVPITWNYRLNCGYLGSN
jgi:hypothetical protein